MSPETMPTSTAKKDEKNLPITINFGHHKMSSLYGPTGLKERIDEFLRELWSETGVKFSRNQFILNAIRYYLRHLIQTDTLEDIVGRMKEELKMVDEIKE